MTETPLPFVYMGEGEFHAASPFWAKRCDQVYKEGQKYTLCELFERSPNSHAHYFAAVDEAWRNLPDDLAINFPNSGVLRKHALIMTGYRRERRMIFETPEIARKVAAHLRPESVHDEYAIISVSGCAVVEWKAKSQNYREMDRREFQKSKTDVLEFLAALIGVTQETLTANAGRAA